MEIFLAFRYPNINGLGQQINAVEKFDKGKINTISDFVNKFSHSDSISEPDHDLTILSETPKILTSILELIKHEDPKHYERLVKTAK